METKIVKTTMVTKDGELLETLDSTIETQYRETLISIMKELATSYEVDTKTFNAITTYPIYEREGKAVYVMFNWRDNLDYERDLYSDAVKKEFC